VLQALPLLQLHAFATYALHMNTVILTGINTQYLEEKVLKPHLQSTHISFISDMLKSTIK